MTDSTNEVVEGAGRYAAWVFAREATADLARATQEWMAKPNWAEAQRLVDSHGTKLAHFRDGHAFEFVEAIKFNANAARAGSAVRATTTASQGQGTAPADIVISLGDDKLRDVQAKLYDRASSTIGVLRADKYEGMQRLVALDREDRIRELLAGRLDGNPDAIYLSGYRDIDSNLTGQLRHGDISSGGTTYAEAQGAGRDLPAWMREQQLDAAVDETLKAAAVGAVGGAVFAGAAHSLHVAIRARHGDLGVADSVAQIAAAAATAGVRAGVTSGLAKVVQIGARNTEVLSPLAESTAPVAIASAVLSTGQAAYDYACGRIDRDELLDRCGEVALRNTGAWAFGVVGQAVVPVPVVGALVGSTAGYVASAAILEGLKLARAAAISADVAEQRLAELEAEALAAVRAMEEHRLTLELVMDQEARQFADTIVPLLDGLEACLSARRDTEAMDQLARLNLELGVKLDWATLPEFDDFMSDADQRLQL